MIPNIAPRELKTGGVTASASFDISKKDTAHIMGILRDTLYSDKVLAVLREYSANAWDAHRMVGKGELPIKVTLPTLAEPTLSIQDFGPGLSHDDVFMVYTQYGASTKRDSDIAVGMLGIGSKSGFSYNDSFTIVTCHGGVRRTYVAMLDSSEKGTIDRLFEEDCGEDTGVTIQIPVRPEDILEFQQTAQELFQYFIPRPDINTTLPPVGEQMILKHGSIGESDDGSWVAIMGCVPYRVNMDQITGDTLPDGGVPSFIKGLSGALYFDIGEVQVIASREELKYSNLTKERLIKKVNLLVEEFVQHTLCVLETGNFTIWEKRLRAQILTRLELPIPKECEDLVNTEIKLKEKPHSFTITTGCKMIEAESLYVAMPTRFLIRDDERAPQGYGLKSFDYVIRPRKGMTLDVIRAELWLLIDELGIKGIPVLDISTLTWTAPIKGWSNRTPKVVNKKHKVSTFRLKPPPFTIPYSLVWEIEEREPTAEDVFVIIENFRANVPGTGNSYRKPTSVYQVIKEDLDLAETFEFPMPVIYGYKTTEKKPVVNADCLGTPYLEWREKLGDRILALPKTREILEASKWEDIRRIDISSKQMRKLSRFLGKAHPIYSFLSSTQTKSKEYRKINWDKRRAVSNLAADVFKDNDSEAYKAQKSITDKYPLLDEYGVNVLANASRTGWIQYVKLIDGTHNEPTEPDEDVPSIFDGLPFEGTDNDSSTVCDVE